MLAILTTIASYGEFKVGNNRHTIVSSPNYYCTFALAYKNLLLLDQGSKDQLMIAHNAYDNSTWQYKKQWPVCQEARKETCGVALQKNGKHAYSFDECQ